MLEYVPNPKRSLLMVPCIGGVFGQLILSGRSCLFGDQSMLIHRTCSISHHLHRGFCSNGETCRGLAGVGWTVGVGSLGERLEVEFESQDLKVLESQRF